VFSSVHALYTPSTLATRNAAFLGVSRESEYTGPPARLPRAAPATPHTLPYPARNAAFLGVSRESEYTGPPARWPAGPHTLPYPT
jgi:hypothetical protein